jgi:hypothetical protein
MIIALLFLRRQVHERGIDIAASGELADMAELGVAVGGHELLDEGLAVLVEER